MDMVLQSAGEWEIRTAAEELEESADLYRQRLQQAQETFDVFTLRRSWVFKDDRNDGYFEYRPLPVGDYEIDGEPRITLIRPTRSILEANRDKVLRQLDTLWLPNRVDYRHRRLTGANSVRMGRFALLSTELNNTHRASIDLIRFEGIIDRVRERVQASVERAVPSRD